MAASPVKSEQKMLFAVKLTKSGKTLEFFFNELPSFEAVLQLLKRHCIFADFRAQYEKIKTIGKGTYAQVILAKKTGFSEFAGSAQNYAIKIFNKNLILGSNNWKQKVLAILF